MINLTNNSKESQKYRSHLYDLLHSDDESNINLAVQILWDLEIPEDWLVFLFQKGRDNNSIKKLLQKNFPQKEFEVAFQWFDLTWEGDLAENLDLLIQLPKLYKAFTWERLLPIYFPKPKRMQGGVAGQKDLKSELLNSTEIPNNEVIPFLIDDNNTLNLPRNTQKVPVEIVSFPKIEGIYHQKYEQQVSFNLPFAITKLNKLAYLELHSDLLYEDLSIDGLPFIDVLRTHNPTVLIRLLFAKYFEYNVSQETLMTKLGNIPLDTQIIKLLKALKYSEEEQIDNELMLLKELYEQESFYKTEIGSNILAFIDKIKGLQSIKFLIHTLQQNSSVKNDRNLAYANLILILVYFAENNIKKCFEISQKTTRLLEGEIIKLMYVLLSTTFFFKLNPKHPLLDTFKNLDRFERFEDPILNHKMGLITYDETFNMLAEIAYQIYNFDPKTKPLLKKVEKEF